VSGLGDLDEESVSARVVAVAMKAPAKKTAE